VARIHENVSWMEPFQSTDCSFNELALLKSN
jgi:hypothetical protein